MFLEGCLSGSPAVFHLLELKGELCDTLKRRREKEKRRPKEFFQGFVWMEVQLDLVGQIRGVFKWTPNSLWPFLVEAFPLANTGETGSQRAERQASKRAGRLQQNVNA